MDGYIDLKSLTFDELSGVVNLYPWFSNARKELCVRLASAGDRDAALCMLREASMYLPAGKVLKQIEGGKDAGHYPDKDIETLLRTYIAGREDSGASGNPGQRHVYAVGGDFFSQEQYDSIRSEDDNIFAGIARRPMTREKDGGSAGILDSPEFYTETLAMIYAEQGYPEQAARIYSQLILAYPEKSAYFANLIRKLEGEN